MNFSAREGRYRDVVRECLQSGDEDAKVFSAADRVAGELEWVRSRAYRDAEATLREMLGSLPARDRRVVEMHYFENRQLGDVAEALDVSYISARRYHHVALQRLGARLAARGVEAGDMRP